MSNHHATQVTDPVAEFLSRGGKIETVDPGVRALDERDIYAKANGRDTLADRQYTEQRMREAENQVALEKNHAYYRW